MTVHLLLQEDRYVAEKWDEFVLASPSTNFFQQSGWRLILEKAFGHKCYFFYTESAGKITGILPLAHVRSFLFGNSLVSLPFAVYGGSAADSEADTLELEHAAMELARRLKVNHLELRNTTRTHETWPAQDLYVTFRKQITRDNEANWKAIPRKQRAMIRKGIGGELQSEKTGDVDVFYRLYADNVRRHGTPGFSKAYFKLLREVFRDSSDILIIRSESQAPVSGVLSFYFKNQVLPYYAGDMPEARALAANDFKYWELMKSSAEKGFTIFDFGRSKKNTGSYSFKKNWGFAPEQLYYEFHLCKADRVPQNNPANPKFKLLIEAWKRLPLFFTSRLGHYLIGGLG